MSDVPITFQKFVKKLVFLDSCFRMIVLSMLLVTSGKKAKLDLIK